MGSRILYEREFDSRIADLRLAKVLSEAFSVNEVSNVLKLYRASLIVVDLLAPISHCKKVLAQVPSLTHGWQNNSSSKI
jgi:hypothetical protein